MAAEGKVKERKLLGPEPRVPRGQVYIITERCKECGFGWIFCPLGVLEKSEKSNIKGYHYPRVKEGKETMIMLCSLAWQKSHCWRRGAKSYRKDESK